MARKVEPIIYNENDINQLKALTQNPLSGKTLRNRAQIILLCIEGYENKQVAKMLDIRPNTVSDVRRRFQESGLDGLYDRERVGRRGNDASSPDDAVVSFVSAHKDENLDVDTICSALNLPDYTVRRILRNHCIQLQRSTVWNATTKDTIIGRYLQLGGIYVSGTTFALIIRALESPDTDTAGIVITRDRTQAENLKAHNKEDKPLSLAEALTIASQADGRTSKTIPFGTFLTQLIGKDADNKDRTHEYHVILYQSDMSQKLPSEVLKHKVIFHSTETLESWQVYVDTVLSVLEPLTGFTSPDKLLQALDTYVTRHLREPFVWYSMTEKKKEVKMAADNPPRTVHIEVDVEIQDGQSLVLLNGTLLNYSNGEITTTTVNRSIPVPTPEEFDFSSVQAYTNTVSAFDNALSTVSDSLNHELMGVCLDSHKKKPMTKEKTK